MAAAGIHRFDQEQGQEHKVLVLEKMERPGRKIMITGKGRCNITNVKPWNQFSSHIHPKAAFLKPAFFNLNPEAMLTFLQEAGLKTVVERGDRAYPASYVSADVVDALVKAATAAPDTELLCGKTVSGTTSVKTREGCSAFRVNCADGTEYTCRKLIITTGGLSYPRTGSTGDGYRWAEAFGHKVKNLMPSLTAVVPKGYKQTAEVGKDELKGHIARETPLSELGSALCGNQLKNVELSLIIDGNVVMEEFGDVDFTDGGLEGPIGFKLSRRCVTALTNGSKVSIAMDLKPAVAEDALNARISNLWNEICRDRRSSGRSYKDKFRVLAGKLMPSSLMTPFLKMNPNADHKTLGRCLKEWKFDIEGFVGYERCVITAGGIAADELTAKTLESKLVPGLYFAGELLDLDGDTGGYNLQIAFSSGFLAGISAARSL